MPIQHTSQMPIIDGGEPVVDQYNRIPSLGFTLYPNAKTAAYTLLAEDSGKVFTTTGASGAVTFTLPAVTNTGFCAWFFNTVDQTMTVTAATADLDKVVADGDAAADSVAFSTASHKIGGALFVVSDGTNWLTFAAGNNSAVPTVAT